MTVKIRLNNLLKINNDVTFQAKKNKSEYLNGPSQMKYFQKEIWNIISETRNYRELASHRKLTSWYDQASDHSKTSQLWRNIHMELKNSSSLEIFRLKTKSWIADKCSYWVWK